MFDRRYVRNTASYLASGRGAVRKLSSFRPGREQAVRSQRGETTMSSIAFNTRIGVTSIAGTRTAAIAPRLRITRRGRTVLTVLIAIVLAGAAATFGLGAAGASAGTHSGSVTTFQYVTV